MTTQWLDRHRSLLRWASVLVPIAVCAALYPIRELVPSSAAALVLVLLVVGAAATSDRASGILAALGGAAGFDYFLTAPYLSFQIANAEDVILAVLLVAVGIAVNELALWGGRQRSTASERAGFIAGVVQTAELAAEGPPGPGLTATISRQIQRTLQAERVEYHTGQPKSDCALMHRDGTVALGDLVLDIDRDGLPTDRHTAIPVNGGYFLVTTATNIVRPNRERRQIATLLADHAFRAGTTGG